MIISFILAEFYKGITKIIFGGEKHMGEKIKKMIQELNYSISSIGKNGLK